LLSNMNRWLNALTYCPYTSLASACAHSRYHRFEALFFTSSSLQAWSMILFGCPGVMPECPFDQSYDTAYAKMLPCRENPVAEMGPGAGSKAAKQDSQSLEAVRDVLDIIRKRGAKLTLETCASIFVPKVHSSV
jgi:hypothetical protein